ncbi:Dihydroorotase homodimeric type [Parasponia andersonii]|uniref:Dihydroorotase homodimeric type n=1 Tax=Parasponia andersonii TaxID=3476 RepID=A0A2P5BLQ5_PARAD|nr:Dihydroorotase homodimeric type [Parasponia andersonii]
MELTITWPDDWHLHLRDGDLLKGVIPHSARHFGRAIVMPNLKPPITTTAAAVRLHSSFDTLFDGYTSLIKEKWRYGVKLYPAGATTNSQDGVADLFRKCLPVLEQMVHGEVTDPDVDIFDREKVFIDTIL